MSSLRPSFIEDIRLEVQATSNRQRQRAAERCELRKNPDNNLFHVKSADQWLKDEQQKPAARQLMGSLWYEDELCILFADTNLGKSILAVQVGYGLGKLDVIEPFDCKLDEAVKVLYIDFELSVKQFKTRYTDPLHGTHHFGDNFFRAEFNPAGDNPMLYDKYDSYIRNEIEATIRSTKARVLIIDNITCMGNSTDYASSAIPLMKSLKALKIKHNLSVLVLAHTPKRNLQKPITVNDLQGSKMLINFADSAFAIGQSHADPGIRYIKQIKQRNTGGDYDAAHVCLFRISKEYSFLCFKFLGYDNEQAHLQKVGVALSNELTAHIAELNTQGLSIRQVAAHLKISASTVARVLKTTKENMGNPTA
ncbi:AAA family ATPase [Mucilaginibacter sp.]|uniref:AAA family ATPase n=1 Tax=Mucilaginibacter sp. TaxID=1882438 RepID=UPI0026047B7E|nr:AAA family ATPase [Mucilaginibacter sp.]MDB4924299.1 hypothetical protein [Mucilaginibacter sp.]